MIFYVIITGIITGYILFFGLPLFFQSTMLGANKIIKPDYNIPPEHSYNSVQRLWGFSLIEPALSIIFLNAINIYFINLGSIDLSLNTHLFTALLITKTPAIVILTFIILKASFLLDHGYRAQLQALIWLCSYRLGASLLIFLINIYDRPPFGLIPIFEPFVVLYITRKYIERWEEEIEQKNHKAVSVGTEGVMIIDQSELTDSPTINLPEQP